MKLKVLLTAFIVASASRASAEEPHFYLGGEIGAANMAFNNGDFSAQTSGAVNSTSTRDSGYQIFGGYIFNKNWAIEAGYANLGRSKNKWYAPANGLYNQNIYTFDYKADAWFASIKGALPVTEQFSVFGKLCVAINEARNSFALDRSRHIEPPLLACMPPGSVCYPPFSNSPIFSNPGNYKTTHTDALVGAGIEYKAFKNASFRFEYEKLGEFGNQDNVGRGKLSLWSLGITYNFQ